MTVYVVLRIKDMSDYHDPDYNVASDSEEIEGIFFEEGKAIERMEKLEEDDRNLSEEIGCDCDEYRIDTWEVQ